MKILIAEDTASSKLLLIRLLNKWGHEVIATENGEQAWEILQKKDSPNLVILDWMMPKMDGPSVCKLARENYRNRPLYIILLTAKESKLDIVEGLNAGADDYVTKPFDPEELRVRVNTGERILKLQMELEKNVEELTEALIHVKQLQGLLPICCYCKKIRDEANYWHQLERYIGEHTDANFSHGICPDCYEKIVQPQIDNLKEKVESKNNKNKSDAP